MLLHFPSSLVTEHRLMSGAEISAMANEPDAASSAVIQNLLRATYVKTVEPGPYDWPGAPQWGSALGGDLVFGLLSTAVENVPKGRSYTFQVQCGGRKHPAGKSRQYKWKLDLIDSMLTEPKPSEDGSPATTEGGAPARNPLRRLSPATVEHLRSKGNRFETTAAGKRIVYKLQSPSDEKQATILRVKVKNFTQAELLAIQCLEIDGLKDPSVVQRWEFFKQLDAATLYGLFEEVQGNDCGIDTAVWTACPECGWEEETDLPFDRIFSPRRT